MADNIHREQDNACERIERAEQRLAQGDSFTRPRRFPWAPDEEVEALENEMTAMYERYR